VLQLAVRVGDDDARQLHNAPTAFTLLHLVGEVQLAADLGCDEVVVGVEGLEASPDVLLDTADLHRELEDVVLELGRAPAGKCQSGHLLHAEG